MNRRFEKSLQKGAQALPMPPMLPAIHLPKGVRLKERGVVKAPRIVKQDVHGVPRDEVKKSNAEEKIRNQNYAMR